ncbi:MAG: hypothetical protein E7142_05835 [Rikenellaceae bacterium]|nr:hypothetical protein [Rikenellaceae bacterium]
MKKVLLVVILSAAISFMCCGEKKDSSTQILELIENVHNNRIFDEIENCKELDNECEYVLKAKNAIDDTRLKLIKLEDVLSQPDQLTSKDDFTKCVYRMMGLQSSVDISSNAFKSHILFLQNFISSKSDNNTTKYIEFKRSLISGDSSIIESGTPVLIAQENFNAAAQGFTNVLSQVLRNVESKDLEAAANSLNREEAIAYRMAMAELLNAFYQFESSRAEYILDVFKSYNDM